MDLHQKWPHRRVNKKTKSAKSQIDGLGVVAYEPISKGETVLVYGGVVVPKTQIEEYRKLMGHSGIQLNDDYFLCPTSREELEITGIINHSCSPNVGFTDQVSLSAIRPINIHEELVLDYAFVESFIKPFACNCRSQNCRKTITPNDWQIKEIQDKYGNYFSPYLKAKISFKTDE